MGIAQKRWWNILLVFENYYPVQQINGSASLTNKCSFNTSLHCFPFILLLKAEENTSIYAGKTLTLSIATIGWQTDMSSTKINKLFGETQLAMWNSQQKALYILLWFVTYVLHILYMVNIYNKHIYVYIYNILYIHIFPPREPDQRQRETTVFGRKSSGLSLGQVSFPLQTSISPSEKWAFSEGPPCPSLTLGSPNTPSGSWRCTCPWTGIPACSRACSPSPGPWPARGRRGTLCRQTSTRGQTVSQAQLGQNCSGDTGDKGLTYFLASGQRCPNPPTSLKSWIVTLVAGAEETDKASADLLDHV